MLATWLLALPGIVALGVAGWLVSLARNDVSHVDSLWSLFFLVAASTFALASAPLDARGLLVIVVVAIWALRLSAYITARNHGKPEDPRYRAIRRRNEPGFAFKSLYLVFGLQALLAWVIALPLLPAIVAAAPLGWLDAVAVGLWAMGFVFEAVGDYQLAAFKRDPENAGRVMDKGLWRYTRHPNYFGEFCIWWAYFLFGLAAGGWWSIVSPLLMTFLLLKVSGVALLERDIGERRPAYAEYVRRTNAFFPGPRRNFGEVNS